MQGGEYCRLICDAGYPRITLNSKLKRIERIDQLLLFVCIENKSNLFDSNTLKKQFTKRNQQENLQKQTLNEIKEQTCKKKLKNKSILTRESTPSYPRIDIVDCSNAKRYRALS